MDEISSPIFKDKVKDIFDRVCNAISVREKWFFGLAVETNEGLIWLKNNKELLRQPIQPENGIIHIKFLVKVSFILICENLFWAVEINFKVTIFSTIPSPWKMS